MSDLGDTYPHDSFSYPDEELDAARNAVLYRDLETASGTFAMQEAVEMILQSGSNGVELDRDRLRRLVQIFDAGYIHWDSFYHDDDGNTIYYDKEGNEVRRINASPETYRYNQERKAERKSIEDYVEFRSPGYIDRIVYQLSEVDMSVATLSVLVERG